MQVEVRIDSSVTEPKVIILTDKMTEEVSGIVRILSENEPRMIAGIKDENVKILELNDIMRVYSSGGKVYAVTASDEYIVRRRLYEMEEILKGKMFARISNSEIINLKKVKNFDLSFSGTICVKMNDGSSTYVSRRYVSRIKEVLGL